MIVKSVKIWRVDDPQKYNHEKIEFVISTKFTYFKNLYVYDMCIHPYQNGYRVL